MMVVVNDENKAYILKQAVDSDGNLLYDGTDVDKRKPIPADPTIISNWVPVGTDFSGDISELEGRIDHLEDFEDIIDKKLSISDNSGLKFDANGALSIKLAENTDTFTNGIELDNGALKVAAYNLRARNTVDNGYAAQYDFIVNGITTTTINIPKDQFLKNAEFVAELSVEDAATYGLESGKPYLKFTWQLEDEPNVTFVPVKDLIDTYTGSDYIDVSNNTISLNLNTVASTLATQFSISETKAKIGAIEDILSGSDDNPGLVANVESNTAIIAANIKDISNLNTTVGEHTNAISTNSANVKALAATITNIQAAGIVNSIDETASYGISLTSTESDNTVVASISVDIDTLAAAVIAKHDVPAPIAENISVADISTSYVNSDDKKWNVQSVLADLDTRITSAVSGGLTNVVAGIGINVTEVSGNKQTISVKASDLVVSGSALTVSDNKIDIVWSEL